MISNLCNTSESKNQRKPLKFDVFPKDEGAYCGQQLKTQTTDVSLPAGEELLFGPIMSVRLNIWLRSFLCVTSTL